VQILYVLYPSCSVTTTTTTTFLHLEVLVPGCVGKLHKKSITYGNREIFIYLFSSIQPQM